MFAAALIVFRETLEAALFVGIVAAAVRVVPGHRRWLALGVLAGVLAALGLASAMDIVARWADGMGQDAVNATVLSLALVLLAWHCVWVSAHARSMSQDARAMARQVAQGQVTLWALTLVVAATVLREGAETVLFVAGLRAGGSAEPANAILGAGIGLLAGVACGWLVAAGLGRLQPRRLFALTNVLVLLLAGGMASQLARTLQQADWVSVLETRVWDWSAWLSNDSPVGVLLHGLVGYDANPTWLQLLAYLVATLGIATAARRVQQRVDGTATVRPGLAT